MKIGLFFGSFDPIHNGHILVSQYFINFSDVQEVCFIVSPQNPLKKDNIILDENHRIKMVKLATEDLKGISFSDIEFSLEKPSYTYITLRRLREKYSEYEFIVIIGEDNFISFERWKNYQEILQNHKIYIYPRILCDYKPSFENQKKIILFEKAPVFKISSTFLRESIREGKDVSFLLNKKVFNYIKEQNIYI